METKKLVRNEKTLVTSVAVSGGKSVFPKVRKMGHSIYLRSDSIICVCVGHGVHVWHSTYMKVQGQISVVGSQCRPC